MSSKEKPLNSTVIHGEKCAVSYTDDMWELLEVDYRTGKFTLGQLSERYGPAKETIRKKAQRFKWQKDLSRAVTNRRKTKLLIDDEAGKPGTDEEIVERAAEKQSGIVKQHQALVAKGLMMADQCADKLDALNTTSTTVKAVKEVLTVLGTFSQVVSKLIPLEREAHGLDVDDKEQADMVPLSERLRSYKKEEPEVVGAGSGEGLDSGPLQESATESASYSSGATH